MSRQQMDSSSKPSTRKISRWIAAALLVCIGFFHATVAFSACLPSAQTSPQTVASGYDLSAAYAEHRSMRVSDLLCKTHCDSENTQASYACASTTIDIGVYVLYTLPVSMRQAPTQSRIPGPDIVELTAPVPVYLLSARLRV